MTSLPAIVVASARVAGNGLERHASSNSSATGRRGDTSTAWRRSIGFASINWLLPDDWPDSKPWVWGAGHANCPGVVGGHDARSYETRSVQPNRAGNRQGSRRHRQTRSTGRDFTVRSVKRHEDDGDEAESNGTARRRARRDGPRWRPARRRTTSRRGRAATSTRSIGEHHADQRIDLRKPDLQSSDQ